MRGEAGAKEASHKPGASIEGTVSSSTEGREGISTGSNGKQGFHVSGVPGGAETSPAEAGEDP